MTEAGTWLLALAVSFALVGPAEPASDAEKQARIDALYEDYRHEFPELPELTVAALMALLTGPTPPVLVDVRDDREREVSIIPGALSREEFEAQTERLAGREVVAYCTIGYRSGVYARQLRQAGWDAFNLRGSILAWTHAAGELARDGSPTKRLHVYGATWDLAADGYEAVW